MIIKWLLFAFALIFISKIVPGVKVEGFSAALFAVAVIGLVNIFISPVVKLLALPINILSLGLFTFIINALLFWLSAYFVSGFHIDGFFAAFLGSVLFSIFSMVINLSTKLAP